MRPVQTSVEIAAFIVARRFFHIADHKRLYILQVKQSRRRRSVLMWQSSMWNGQTAGRAGLQL
jgi:hypothetical protein